MEKIEIQIFKFILEIIVFLILMVIFDYLFGKIKKSSYRIFNPKEYFPQEEIHSLRQIFYLMMMGLIFADIMYTVLFLENDLVHFALLDIIISLYLAINMEKSSLKDRILLVLLIPYGSLTFVIFGKSLVGILDIIHIPVLAYFIKVYYSRFREYTDSNGLGITILLLFVIIFISFLLTQVTEQKSPLDALVMVSNAFTSNGYAVLGSSMAGKLNSIVLVWSGYLLSGVGTATLTAGILINYFKGKIEDMEKSTTERLDKMEEMEKSTNERLDKIEELIKKQNEND